MIRVAVAGASGYMGAELLRILFQHPKVRVTVVTSERLAGEPFVRVCGEGERPATRAVVGSNYCDLTVVADRRIGRAVCVSALDNLGKGGSANGVQNLNVMFGWNERTGLEAPPVYP